MRFFLPNWKEQFFPTLELTTTHPTPPANQKLIGALPKSTAIDPVGRNVSGADRDAWLKDAVFFLVHDRWPACEELIAAPFRSDGNEYTQFEKEAFVRRAQKILKNLKQYSFDSVYPVAGKLRNYMTVTGDVSFHGILDKIPSEHWRHYEVSLSSFVHDAEHVETARDGLPDDGSFVALKVGRTKTESLKVALRTNPVLGVEPNVTR